MPGIGPTGAHRAHRAAQAQHSNIGSHAFGALGSILEQLLRALQHGYLPKLKVAELVASMFSGMNQMLTGGATGPDADWKDRAGPSLANEKNMSAFLKSWVFFTAATGSAKPEGVSPALWKEMKELVGKANLPPNLLEDMKEVLNDPAFKQLAKDVIANSQVFAKQQGWLDKRRDLFKGHPSLQKQYDADLAAANDLRRQLFELDPKSPTYKEDKAKLEKELHAKEADMRKLADKAGVTGQYDQYTKEINTLEDERIAIMTRVRDEDIPAVQKGRAGEGGKEPNPTDKARYDKLSGATNSLATYANGELAKAKTTAQLAAMKAGKLGPILSKIIKELQKIAEFIIHQKLNQG